MPDSPENVLQAEKLAALMEMAALSNSDHERPVVINHAINSICRLTDAETGSLLMLDKSTGHLDFEVALGINNNTLHFFRVPKGHGIAGWVADNNTPLIVPDAQADERFFPFVDKEINFVTRDMIVVPVRLNGAVIGVMQVINKKSGSFNHDDLKLAMAFANQIAPVISKTNNGMAAQSVE